MALVVSILQAPAFSLLGPYAPWMDVSKSYQLPGDIGGPMNIGEGYRWNIPVVTYGFERSFLDYFGSNGVAAVDSAIQVLNNLPSASQINLQSFPLTPWHRNFRALAFNLLDLKSQVLGLLLEQMGLAEPERFTWCIRDFESQGSNYTFFVIRRNFDPATAQSSAYVNATLFTYRVIQFAASPTQTNRFCDAAEFVVDSLAEYDTTAAGFVPGAGYYLSGLSQDDAGGLRYLFSGNQVRQERLLPDVHLAEPATNVLVQIAPRPGIEKLTFVRHPTGLLGGEFQTFTNQWTDVYYVGNQPGYQRVERIITRPDIVFAAQDLGVLAAFARTGTTNWSNNADLNGNLGGAGPGVIRPPILITLNNVGPFLINQGPSLLDESNNYPVAIWGSFDGTTNQPVWYPATPIPFQPSQVQLRLVAGSRTNEFRWSLSGPANGRFSFQTSTALSAWTTLATMTNSGATFELELRIITAESSRFYRTVPEP